MKNKQQITLVIKIGLTIIIFWAILRKINFSQLAGTFSSPDLKFLVFAVGLAVPNFAIKFFKWHFLLNASHIPTDKWTASKSYLAGLSIGMITPARAGEVSRAFFLEKQYKLQAIGVVLVDKVMDLLGIIAWSLIGARIFLDRPVFIALVLLVLMGIVLLFSSKPLYNKLTTFLKPNGLGLKIQQILSTLDKLSGRVLFVSIVSTLIMFMVVLLQCHALVLTFYHQPLPFQITLFAYPLVILANILPITIGGLGVREGVAVFCLSFFGLPPEIAVTATLYLFLINVLGPSLMGYCIILRTRM